MECMTTAIHPRPRSRADLAAWYQSLFEMHAASKLSLKAFAVEQNIPLQNLYNWRRRLVARGSEPQTGELRPRKQPGLIELDLRSDSSEMPALAQHRYVLTFNDRCTLEIPKGFNVSEAQTLIALIKKC